MMFTAFFLALMLSFAKAKQHHIRGNYEFGRRVRATSNNILQSPKRRKMVQLFLSDIATNARQHEQDNFFRSLKNGSYSLSYVYHSGAHPTLGYDGQEAQQISGDPRENPKGIVVQKVISDSALEASSVAKSGETGGRNPTVSLSDGLSSGAVSVVSVESTTTRHDESVPLKVGATSAVAAEKGNDLTDSLKNSAGGATSLRADEGSSLPPVEKTTTNPDDKPLSTPAARAGNPVGLSEGNQGAVSSDVSNNSAAGKTTALTAAQAPSRDTSLIASIIAAVAAALILVTAVGYVAVQRFGLLKGAKADT